MKPIVSKTKAINQLKRPENSKALKSLMGAVNYYTKWVPDLAKITQPVKHLLKRNTKYIWSDKEEIAFKATKEAISNSTKNNFFDVRLPCVLSTDASLSLIHI